MPDAVTHKDLLPVGEYLKRRRQRLGHSRQELAELLHIRLDYLQALEENRFDDIPGEAYIQGFLRSYGEYVGMDGEAVVAYYKNQTGRICQPSSIKPITIKTDFTRPGIIGVSIGFAVIVTGIIGWQMTTEPEQVAQRTIEEPAPEEFEQGERIIGGGPLLRLDLSAPFALSGGRYSEVDFSHIHVPQGAYDKRIEIKAKNDSWIKIVDADGKEIVAKLLGKGQSWYLSGSDEGLRMMTGNAGGLRIVIDGQELPPLGRPGQVLENIPLGAKSLTRYAYR